MAARRIARDRVDQLGEGPIWSARENALYWVDILSHRVNRMALDDESVRSWELPDYVGWVIEREAGGLVAGVGRTFAHLTLDPLMLTPIANPDDDRTGNRVNDAKADAQGRIWAGTMPLEKEAPTGAFYLLDTDGRATRVDDGYWIANGPAIAPDSRSLFHTDSMLRTIFRFAIREDGSLGARETHIAFEDGWGDPDGMTIDADGGLWVACWGASCVTRFTPEGKRDRSIALPASQITSCAFAGPNLDRMFVTSAADGVDEADGGALFEVDPGCRGLPTLKYGG